MNIKYNITEEINYKEGKDLFKSEYVPEFILVNNFNENSSKDFRENYYNILNKKQNNIPIYVDSFGGEVYSLLSMLDTIKNNNDKIICTIGTGKQMSCGAIFCSSGTKGYRYVQPNTTVMIHSVSNMAIGSIENLKNDINEADRLNNIIFELLDNNTEKPKGFWKEMFEKNKSQNLFLTAEECIKYGIADKIGTPSFDINVNVEIKFNK